MNSQEIIESVTETKNYSIFKESLSSKLFLAYLIAIGALALTHILSTVICVFFFGATGTGAASAVRVSSVVWSRIGYICVAVINVAKPIIFTLSSIYIFKLIKNKDSFSINHISILSRIPAVLFIYSFFTLVDCGFFVVGATNETFTENVFAFLDMLKIYRVFDIGEWETTVISRIILVTLTLAYGIFQFIMYASLKATFSNFEVAVKNDNFSPEKKAPFILPMVFTGVNVVFAVFMFINGSWVSALINLAIAAYLAVTALYLKSLHKKMFN